MNDDEPPFPSPPPPPGPSASRKFPTWLQALVMFGGGLVLAVSACFGCVFTHGDPALENSLGLTTRTLINLAWGGVAVSVIGAVILLLCGVHGALWVFKTLREEIRRR